MRKLLRNTMAAALMVWAVAASAYPNLSATTGLIGVPNGNVVPAGQLVGAADFIFFDDSLLNARVVYGLTPRFEGGAAVVLGDDTGVILNGKYQLPSTFFGFTSALGATFSTGSDSGDGWQIYLAGTRSLFGEAEGGSQLFGTVGVNFTDLEDATGIRPFFGAQWVLGGGMEIGGEFMLEAGDFNESISSLYLRHTFTPGFSGQVGFTNANGFAGQDDHDLFVGASFAF